jgi:hypothetical protein
MTLRIHSCGTTEIDAGIESYVEVEAIASVSKYIRVSTVIASSAHHSASP